MYLHQNDIRISASVALSDTRADETTVAYATVRPLRCTPGIKKKRNNKQTGYDLMLWSRFANKKNLSFIPELIIVHIKSKVFVTGRERVP